VRDCLYVGIPGMPNRLPRVIPEHRYSMLGLCRRCRFQLVAVEFGFAMIDSSLR